MWPCQQHVHFKFTEIVASTDCIPDDRVEQNAAHLQADVNPPVHHATNDTLRLGVGDLQHREDEVRIEGLAESARLDFVGALPAAPAVVAASCDEVHLLPSVLQQRRSSQA